MFCVWDTYGTTSNYAELFAIFKALTIAWNRNERRITIRTDSNYARMSIFHYYDVILVFYQVYFILIISNTY